MAGSIIGKVAGGLVGGLIGGKGDKKASRQLQQGANAAGQIRPQPFPINTLLGNSQQGSFNPTQLFQYFNNDIETLRNKSGALNFDRNAFADRLIRGLEGVQNKRDQRNFAGLESTLFNQSGASMGSGRALAEYRDSLLSSRLNRRFQADAFAGQEQSRQIGDYMNILGGARALQGAQLNQIGQGIQGSSIGIPLQHAQQQGLLGAAQTRAQGTQAFFGNLGGNVQGAVETGVNRLFNPPPPIGGGSGSAWGGYNHERFGAGHNLFGSLGF